jgi:hypothetical protein
MNECCVECGSALPPSHVEVRIAWAPDRRVSVHTCGSCWSLVRERMQHDLHRDDYVVVLRGDWASLLRGR